MHVAVGNDKFARAVLERGRVPDRLVKETWQPHGKAAGAIALHHQVGVSDMVPVIRRVHVDAVPARRKHELKANPVRAIGVQVALVRQEMTEQRRLGIFGVVETVETSSPLCKRGLVGLVQSCPLGLRWVDHGVVSRSEIAARVVASDHAETFWVRHDLAFPIIRVKEVIGKHTPHRLDKLVLAGRRVEEVEGRLPVRGLVLRHHTRCAIACSEVGVGGRVRQTSGARKDVHVVGRHARRDHGVNTCEAGHTTALHTPEC